MPVSGFKMLLFDCGNSSVAAAVSKTDKSVSHLDKFYYKEAAFLNDLTSYIEDFGIKEAVFCSVVPGVTEILTSIFHEKGIVHYQFRAEKSGIVSHYRFPGDDRILFAYAVKNLYPGRAAALIDAGSALTVDYLSSDGEFLGGFLMPGVQSAFDSLSDVAPVLAGYSLEKRLSFGADTKSSIQSGFTSLFAGGIKEAIRIVRDASKEDLLILVTGGDGLYIASLLEEQSVSIEPDILLKGLVMYGLKKKLAK